MDELLKGERRRIIQQIRAEERDRVAHIIERFRRALPHQSDKMLMDELLKKINQTSV